MNIREFLLSLSLRDRNSDAKKYILYVHPKELSTTYTKVLFNDTVIKDNIELFAIDTNTLIEYNQFFLKEFNDKNKQSIIVTNEKFKNRDLLSKDKRCKHISLTCTLST